MAPLILNVLLVLSAAATLSGMWVLSRTDRRLMFWAVVAGVAWLWAVGWL